jgi:hypothetical protein
MVKRRSDNSGVFIRFSDPDADPWNAIKTGYEIQIDDLALPEGRAEQVPFMIWFLLLLWLQNT